MAGWTYFLTFLFFVIPLFTSLNFYVHFFVIRMGCIESNNGAKARNERLYYGCGQNGMRFSRFSVIATYKPPSISLFYPPGFRPLIVVCRRWNSEWVSRWRKIARNTVEWGKHNRGVFHPQTPSSVFLKSISSHLYCLAMLYTKSTNIVHSMRVEGHITETIPADISTHKKISERRRSPKNIHEWDSSLIFRIRSKKKSLIAKKTNSERRGY